MCGGGGKGSSGGFGGLAPAQQQTVQASPEAIGWYQQAMHQAQAAAGRPFQQFGTTAQDFVAGLNPTQTGAIQNITNAQGMAQPFYQAAAGTTQQALNPAYNTVGNYMTPFMGQVVDPVKQAVTQQQGQQLAQQQAEAIRGGAFGGERAGLQRAQLMGQQNLGLGQALSPLYQTGYGQALQAAQQQQQYGLQGAQQLAGIGTAAQQAALGQAQAQLGAGTLGQQTQQAGINALYNQFQQQQMFPYMQAQFLAGIAGGLGPLMGQQTFQSQAQSPFGMFLSDPRAKTGVGRDEPDVVGELYDGQKVHAYKYKDGGPAQIGLMADEVAERHPDAVGVRPDGLMAVDYGTATEDAARLGRGLGMARMGGAVTGEGDYARGGYADGGLTSGDIASILAAHQAMYGQMPKAQTGIPTEGIKTGTPLTPGHMTPQEREASGLSKAIATGSGIADLLTKGADLYSWYQGDKSKGPTQLSGARYHEASGGIVPANEDEDLWKGLTGGIRAAQGLRAADLNTPGADKDPSRQRGFLDTAADTLGTAGKVAGGLSGLYSAASTLGPALLALSDPRAKTGVGRDGYEEGGPARRYSPEDIETYLRPLAKGESGGEKDPYAALGPTTKSGDRAYGKYQIMGANIPSWSKEAGLGPMTAQEFLANKEAQEKIAQHRFGKYLEQTNAPEEAAAMWFAGPGYKKHMGARDVLGTSIPEYQARYRRNLDRGLGEEIAKLGPRERSFQASANLPPEGTTVDLKKGVGAPAPASTTPESLEDKLLSRQTIIPALAGLGAGITAMTSSPSRYLGTAIAQGLGAGLTAGAKSYMDTGLQIPEIDKRTQEALKEAQEVEAKKQLVKKMGFETIEEMMKAYGSAFFTSPAGVPMVRLADGTVTTEVDFRRNPRPVFGQEAAAPGTQKPLVSTQPVVAPPGIVFDNRSSQTARNEMDSVYGSTKQAAEAAYNRSQAYRDKVDKDAEAAQAQKLLILDVGGIVSEAAHATGMNTPGAGGTTRAMIVNYGNTVARAAGYGENYFGSSDTNAALLSKLNTLQGQRGVQAAQQTALGSLAKLVDAQPNLDQPPKASIFNSASNLVNNQMQIDQRDHADTYGQASGGLFSRAGVDFKRTHTPGKYRKEQEALMKVMWEDPQGFSGMISGRIDPKDIEQYFRDPKHGGITGMSRYFGG